MPPGFHFRRSSVGLAAILGAAIVGAAGLAAWRRPSGRRAPSPALTQPPAQAGSQIHRVRVPSSPPATDRAEIEREIMSGDQQAIADLAAMLSSPCPPPLRRTAAALLAKMGTPAAVAALLDGIMAARDDHVRGDLLPALRLLSNREAAPALAALLLRTPDQAVVGPVRDAFARLADSPGVLEIAISFHEAALERWQQTNLMGVLLRVRLPEAVPALREIMLRDSNPALRAQAAISLGSIGNDEAAAALAAALAQSRSAAFTEVIRDTMGGMRKRF